MLARREHFVQMSRLLAEPLLLIDERHVIAASNRPAADCFARTSKELDGSPLTDVVTNERDRVESWLKLCARTRSATPTTLTLRDPQGEAVDYRAEGGRCSGPDEPAAVLLRLVPKELANHAFVTLNQELRELGESRRALAQKTEVIERQRWEILKLGSAIIEIWDDILLVPLHGELTMERGMYLIEKLLCRIIEVQARFVIIDLTGIEHLDAQGADSLGKMESAVRLIGSRCVLTGLGPKLAAVLPATGVSLGSLLVKRSLRDALHHCLDLGRAMPRRARP